MALILICAGYTYSIIYNSLTMDSLWCMYMYNPFSQQKFLSIQIAFANLKEINTLRLNVYTFKQGPMLVYIVSRACMCLYIYVLVIIT